MTERTKRRKARDAPASRRSLYFKPKWAVYLFGFFLLSLAPRLYGGFTFGTNLDGPGTFSMVNYDEGGSCRAVLGDFPYPTFLGYQILTIAKLLGHEPPRLIVSEQQGKAYCQSRPLIMIQRAYAGVTGALTVVLTGLIALMMWPQRPRIAWTACALLGFSNLHVAQSHWGTADAPQVFFIYLFATILTYGLASGRKWPLLLSPFFLVGAVWAKWYFFAIFGYAAILPQIDLKDRASKYAVGFSAALALLLLAVSWDAIGELISERRYLIWGSETGRFGTTYGNIGTWRRWIRNSVNLPVSSIVGIGLPASLFVLTGIKRALADRNTRLLWLTQAPALAYAVYMLVLAPVVYYRHYLPLFPTVVLLAAYGLWESRLSTHKLFLAFFFLYPVLLTADFEYNYRMDPRRELRSWYADHRNPRVYATFYVVPPRTTTKTTLFNMERYIRYGARYLANVEYIILSENWYDTSYPNELNGPIAWKPEWLIKTKPEYVVAYREILSGRDPNLELEREFNLKHVMPEFLIHRFFYGSFPLFIGDLKIYRVVRN